MKQEQFQSISFEGILRKGELCLTETVQNRKEMGNGSCQNKKVPDAVPVFQVAPGVKNNPQRVTTCSNKKEGKTRGRQVFHHGNNGNQKHPAHGHVKPHHQFSEPGEVYGADNDAGDGKGPDDAKQGPSQWSANGG